MFFFSGAELEGLVKSAASFALNRQIDVNDLSKTIDEENIKICMEDFKTALEEVIPAFGATVELLDSFRLHGMADYGARYQQIMSSCKTLVRQVESSESNPLVTALLEGPAGSGKTAIAATVAMESGFPFVKVVSAESMIGMSESAKCNYIARIFDDAYKVRRFFIIFLGFTLFVSTLMHYYQHAHYFLISTSTLTIFSCAVTVIIHYSGRN